MYTQLFMARKNDHNSISLSYGGHFGARVRCELFLTRVEETSLFPLGYVFKPYAQRG